MEKADSASCPPFFPRRSSLYIEPFSSGCMFQRSPAGEYEIRRRRRHPSARKLLPLPMRSTPPALTAPGVAWRRPRNRILSPDDIRHRLPRSHFRIEKPMVSSRRSRTDRVHRRKADRMWRMSLGYASRTSPSLAPSRRRKNLTRFPSSGIRESTARRAARRPWPGSRWRCLSQCLHRQTRPCATSAACRHSRRYSRAC
jgi:hypothetical protein